jgi:hypothetical protein
MKTMLVRWSGLLLVTVLFVGCTSEKKPVVTAGGTAAPAATGHSHAGHGTGPHEGTVADWGGGKFHVEFTVDHGKQETVVYVLGGDEKTPAPVKAKDGMILLSIKQPAFQVELKADPQPGESGGASSRYIGKNEKLGVVQEFAGTISGEIDGTPYVGDFKEEPHGAQEHK